jgi:hypothetical protein
MAARERSAQADRKARAERLLALFAWHRDGPLVARSLGLSLDELHAQLDELKLRRKAYRLVRGSDHDLPLAKPLPGAPSGPSVRRRARAPEQQPLVPAMSRPAPALESPPQPPVEQRAAAPAGGVAEQQAELLRLLADLGPRRGALAVRRGAPGRPVSERALLARFRAAGLERELGQRERDLVRGLFARHRGAARAVAGELGLDAAALERLLRERGLTREIEELRERFRAEARSRSWPREQIEQLCRRREWLEDLGIAAELERDVLARARPAWEAAGGSLPRLRRDLRLAEADARALHDLIVRAQ